MYQKSAKLPIVITRECQYILYDATCFRVDYNMTMEMKVNKREENSILDNAGKKKTLG